MSRIKDVARKVKLALWESPETRCSDRKLILKMYEDMGVADYSFREVMEMDGLPSFESIRRARQKVQEQTPWLRGDERTEAMRMENQVEFLEFAREGI